MKLFFDAHAHVYDLETEPESYIVSSSANSSDWCQILQLAARYEKRVFPALGLHPYEVAGFKNAQEGEALIQRLEQYLKNEPRIVAISECGLDLRYPKIDLQRELLSQQIELAERYHKPLVLHCVRAYSPLQSLLAKRKLNVPLVLHAFRASPEIADWALKRGFYLSFSPRGLRHNHRLERIIAESPSEQILLESDFLANKGYDIEQICAVYQRVSELRTIELSELMFVIRHNAKKVFGLSFDESNIAR
ncbi:MAG: TatD family hydrolase [Bradymonadales bacterium]|jgi:TatD DNase family protein